VQLRRILWCDFKLFQRIARSNYYNNERLRGFVWRFWEGGPQSGKGREGVERRENVDWA